MRDLRAQFVSLVRVLVGRPLAWGEESERKVGIASGVPALGLDAIASAAYGPEAALTVLAAAGALSQAWIIPITLAIIVLLALLYWSYRQTIAAYPGGGGSYTVAKENLGVGVGLLAGAALMIDYTLNVAVGISAGVGALTSALPQLHHHTLALCLLILGLITLANLRGTREAGIAFAVPAYLFIASVGGILVWGAFLSSNHPAGRAMAQQAAIISPSLGGISSWLVLRAFASGCTAMTGVEAVSNGVTAFKDPAVKHARRTLTVIVGVLILLLVGIAWSVETYAIRAMDQSQAGYQSVLSQIASAVAGRSTVYYVTMASVLAVLCLSANTSFVGFPRLCRLIAEDQFLPIGFATVGRRLVYSVGIGFLAFSAGLLLIFFRGITDRLIPLFAVGAFSAFTLSQTGMVVHWSKQAHQRPRSHVALARCVNAVGAIATFVALAIIILAKFAEGAWIVIVAVPALLLVFRAVRRHYGRVDRTLAAHRPIKLTGHAPPVVLLPTRSLDRIIRKSLPFGMRLSPHVIAVHLSEIDGEPGERHENDLRRAWSQSVEAPARQAGLPVPRLVVIKSAYRRFTEPLLAYIRRVESEFPGRVVAVLVPELVEQNWWEFLLHKHRARRLRSALMRSHDPHLIVITVPWYVAEADG